VKLVFFGPPGSGKGTQAVKLAAEKGYPHISLGDLLRKEMHDGTEIGSRIKEFMNAGKLVPDEITIEITRNTIAGKNDWILDGFPRSFVQAEAFDQMLKESNVELDKVIYFDVPEDLVVERLCGRRSCRECGAVYHIKYNSPKKEGICDRCGKELYQRGDDNEKAIRTRFKVYAEQTKPLVERYQQAGKMSTVAAGSSIDEIYKQLLSIIKDAGN